MKTVNAWYLVLFLFIAAGVYVSAAVAAETVAEVPKITDSKTKEAIENSPPIQKLSTEKANAPDAPSTIKVISSAPVSHNEFRHAEEEAMAIATQHCKALLADDTVIPELSFLLFDQGAKGIKTEDRTALSRVLKHWLRTKYGFVAYGGDDECHMEIVRSKSASEMHSVGIFLLNQPQPETPKAIRWHRMEITTRLRLADKRRMIPLVYFMERKIGDEWYFTDIKIKSDALKNMLRKQYQPLLQMQSVAALGDRIHADTMPSPGAP